MLRTFSSASIAPSAAMCSATFSPPLYSWMVGIFCGDTREVHVQSIQGKHRFQASGTKSYTWWHGSNNCAAQLGSIEEVSRPLTLMPAPYTSADGTAFTSTKSTGSLHTCSAPCAAGETSTVNA